VQNWNDGKAQEFKQRRTYDIGRSRFHGVRHAEAAVQTPEPAVKAGTPAPEVEKPSQAILFARVTCPNCRIAEAQLTKAGFPFEKRIAEENVDLVKQYGVKGAPTLVVLSGDKVEKFYGVPEIKQFLAGAAARV